jgi:hypothetical protein
MSKTNVESSLDAVAVLKKHFEMMGVNRKDLHSQVEGVLCHLHHLCNNFGVDWEAVTSSADYMWESEICEEADKKEAIALEGLNIDDVGVLDSEMEQEHDIIKR